MSRWPTGPQHADRLPLPAALQGAARPERHGAATAPARRRGRDPARAGRHPDPRRGRRDPARRPARARPAVVLARGGDGGCGNVRFKSSTNQAPRRATPGSRARSAGSGCSSSCSPTPGWSACPTPASRPSSPRSRAPAQDRRLPVHHARAHARHVVRRPRQLRGRRHPGPDRGRHEGTGLGDRFLGHVERSPR